MVEVSFNDIHKKQNKTLVPATFKKGFVSSVYASTATVDVFLAENPQTIIRNVPVSSAINIAQVMKGDRCRLDLFDETNSNDMVVAYTYGRVIQDTKQKKVQFTSGSIVVPFGSSFPYVIPHGLKDADNNPVIPDLFSALGLQFAYSLSGTTYYMYQQSVSADATNITITSSINPSNAVCTVYWWAIKFI